MDQKFVYVVHNIKHLWVIMWHIFTSTNNTTRICLPHNYGNCYTHIMSLNNVLKKKQLLSLFINFLFISINEKNRFAESMFFVGVHWMEFVSRVKFRQLQTQR
jgi:hypothetical protein